MTVQTQRRHAVRELAQGRDLECPGAVQPVAGHHRVAGVPLAAWFWIEPVQTAGQTRKFRRLRQCRRPVVAARVAHDEHSGLAGHDIGPPGEKRVEGATVVTASVHGDQPAAGEQPVRIEDTVGRLEQVRDLYDPVHKCPRPHVPELAVQRVQQREDERCVLGHGARDIAQHHQVRLGRTASSQLRIERNAP